MLRVGVVYDRIVDMADDMYLPEEVLKGAKLVADSCVKAQEEGNHEVAKFFYDFIEDARLYIKMLVKEFEEPGGERSAQMEASSFLRSLFDDACMGAAESGRYDVLYWIKDHNMEIDDGVLMLDNVAADLDMVRFLVEECGVRIRQEVMSNAISGGNNEFVEMVYRNGWYARGCMVGA